MGRKGKNNMKKYTQAEVQRFTDISERLLSTGMKMEDIYQAIISNEPKSLSSISFDESGKMVKQTYSEFKDEVFKTSSRLSKLLSNIAPGTVVGIKLKNSPKWPIVFWALLMCGHSPLLIDARLPKENADNLLRQAKAKAIVSNDEEEFSVPKYRLNDIAREEADYQFRPDWANHLIFCSSGTTGDAKMMVYTGKNMVAQILAAKDIPNSSLDLIYPGEIRNFAMLPYHHIFGFIAVYLWFAFYGKTHVYPASGAVSDMLYAIKKGKCSHVFSVPLLWDKIAQTVNVTIASMKPGMADIFSRMIAYNTNKISKKEAGLGGSKHIHHLFQKKVLGTKIRYCISGGGFLSPKTQNTINGIGYPLYNGFGMTEVGIASVETSPIVETRLRGSIGKPFYGISYRIVKNGEVVEGEDAAGELQIKSDIVHSREIIGGTMKYVSFKDGYFPSGDIAYRNSEGQYFLRGRIKDTIILSNGENVYPDEIESYFKDVKNLNNVVCLGAKFPGEHEEKITLVCEVDNSVTPETLEKIHEDIKAINATLQTEKRVQAILVNKRPLPLSGSMKVKRFLIKENIEKGNGDFIAFDAPKKKIVSFEGFDPEEVSAILSGVTKVFAKVLALPEFKIDPSADWGADLGGDSMSYIDMCQTLNKEFKVDIPEKLWGQLMTANDFAKEILTLKKQ